MLTTTKELLEANQENSKTVAISFKGIIPAFNYTYYLPIQFFILG